MLGTVLGCLPCTLVGRFYLCLGSTGSFSCRRLALCFLLLVGAHLEIMKAIQLLTYALSDVQINFI